MPPILLHLFFFSVGLALLIASSGWLIQASVKLAQLLRLSMLFIGAVIIAFGTSAPEAGVGIVAAIRDSKGIALGNIIGSNIANIGLIIGLCAFIRPIHVKKHVFRLEAPLMLLSVILFYLLAGDFIISRLDGLLFLVLFLIFCFFSYRNSKKVLDNSEVNDFTFNPLINKIKTRRAVIAFVLAAIAGVVVGADLMVRSGSQLAVIFGVPAWIIGITVFAVGTSLPELVTSLNATVKGISTISVGNVVGSNIFNLLFVLGVVALIRPIEVGSQLFLYELPVLLVFTFVFFTVMRLGYTIRRLEGVILFLGYIAFLWFLFPK
jgi:cation:H+ antiporter